MEMTLQKNLLILSASFVGLALAAQAQGQSIANDPFLTGPTPASGQYATGSTIEGQNPTVTGFSGAWQLQFTNNAQPANVVSSSLSYAASGYSTSGGSYVSPADGRWGRALDAGTNPFNSDGTVYLSFLLQVSDINGYKTLELNNSGDDSSRAFSIGLGIAGNSNFQFQINNNASLTGNFGAVDTNVHLFVVRFDLSGASDSVTAWMDPTLPVSGNPSGGVTISGFNLRSVDRTYFAAFGSPGTGTGFDEVRMGNTFQAVTLTSVPEPTPTAIAIGGLCGVAMLGRRLSRRTTA